MKKWNTPLSIIFLCLIVLGSITCNKDDDTKSNQPPTCQITAPEDGQQITIGQTVTVSVNASDSDGSVEEVRFFIDGVGKSTAGSFPYNYTWNTNDESAGNHLIKAMAFDNNGEQKSDEITVDLAGGGGNGCEGITEVNYKGQVYNTVHIGNQCWFKENLNVGTMIQGTQDMTDNEIIEKYCYYNEPDSCDKYGGLYQWNEMMQYSTQQGAQGVCPDGWHLPSDEEWKELEGVVDSQYGYPDPEWDNTSLRGFNAGLNLKSTSLWDGSQAGNGNGTDKYGFGALPGGSTSLYPYGIFGFWWSSSETSGMTAWSRFLSRTSEGSYRDDLDKTYGFSVRCLKDN